MLRCLVVVTFAFFLLFASPGAAQQPPRSPTSSASKTSSKSEPQARTAGSMAMIVGGAVAGVGYATYVYAAVACRTSCAGQAKLTVPVVGYALYRAGRHIDA